MSPGGGRRRAVRGLALVFLLSFVNLVGAFLALATLGGLGEWTRWQFIGLFGLVETAMGLAFIIGPNIWRLPVAEGNTSPRTRVRLAASALLMPHWAAVAKAGAGAGMLLAAAVHEGVSPATPAVLLVIAALLVAVLGLSLVFARLGVARPDLDVVAFTLHRPGQPDRKYPGISFGGTFVQLIVNIGVFPAVKVLPPTLLYQPEVAPSLEFVGYTGGLAVALAAAGLLAWWGRISVRAPREQQREAEAEAEGQLP